MSTTSDAARPIEPASPQELGFSAKRLAGLKSALEREVADGRIPGAVIAIARRGRLAMLDAVGFRDKSAAAPMKTDAIFSIASMTKPMTSVAAMMLHEEGRLLLGDPVAKYLPQLTNLEVVDPNDESATLPSRRGPTIQDLLRHTSGFGYYDTAKTPAHKLIPGSSFTAATRFSREDFLSRLAAAPLLFEPGSNWEYGFSTDVLGLVVETVAGKPLDEVLAERIWRPLGMRDTAVQLDTASRARYARALDKDPITGTPADIFHAGTAALQWIPGGAACVSTAGDYIRFAEMVRRGGLGLIGPRTVKAMTTDHLAAHLGDRIADGMDPAASGYGFGLGFAVRRQDGRAAMLGSQGDCYWSGVYGTYFWIDPREEMSVVFMAVAPGVMRLRYRQLIRGLVYQAIEN